MRYFCLMLTFPLLAMAQPAIPPADGHITVPLLLHPAKAQRPLSAWYLLPLYGEQQPGERVLGFLNCFMEQDVFYNRDNTALREKALQLPLKELATSYGVENGLAYKPKYAGMLVRIDQAARYTRTEWNEHFNLRRDGAYFGLPEVQKLRQLAQVLHLRLRLEVKAREFDKCIVTLRTMFGLSKTLETNPTLIAQLVGAAVVKCALDGLEEMIAQPGCPNLYWSFQDLPNPLLDSRRGTEGERLFMDSQFKNTVPTDRALNDKQLGEAVQTVREVQGFGWLSSTERPDDTATKYTLMANNAKLVDATRKRLVNEDDLAEAVVNAMPPLQVAMLEDVRQYRLQLDESLKWMNRPAHEALPGLLGSAEDLARLKKEGWVLSGLSTPALLKVKIAQARLQQRVALLSVVEAVRLHAADNGGTLPAKLSDIRLSLPNDPATDKPFTYSVAEGTATLYGTKPLGDLTPDRRLSLRFAPPK